jgi:hypothetical protein
MVVGSRSPWGQCSSLASLGPGPDGRAGASFWVRPGLPYLMALTSEPRARAPPIGPGQAFGSSPSLSGSEYHCLGLLGEEQNSVRHGPGESESLGVLGGRTKIASVMALGSRSPLGYLGEEQK